MQLANLAALRRLHGGWAESQARVAAALGARRAAAACEVATGGAAMLPGPALQAVADELMAHHFQLWRPASRARVSEC